MTTEPGALRRDPDLFTLRAARDADFARITDLYRHHVLNGLATFEIEPPDEGEMRRRHADIAGRGMPYVVAEVAKNIAGYAYAGPYRARVAYRYTLEDSIYLDPAYTQRGIGRALLELVLSEATQAGFRQMIAVIGDSANISSLALHRVCGFSHVGVLQATGWKFGRWVDSVLMQRALGEGNAAPPPPPLESQR
jgi:L-amino acid N-acyltransferase YncA